MGWRPISNGANPCDRLPPVAATAYKAPMQSTPLVADEFPPVSEAEWRALVARSLGGGLESLTARSDDGIPVGPIYGQAAAGQTVAAPGRWTIVQRIDLPDVAAAKRQMAEDFAPAAPTAST